MDIKDYKLEINLYKKGKLIKRKTIKPTKILIGRGIGTVFYEIELNDDLKGVKGKLIFETEADDIYSFVENLLGGVKYENC